MTAVRFAAGAVLATIGALGLAAAATATAHADSAPTIAFDTQEVTTPFGGDWLVEVHLTVPDGWTAADAAWGTVDIQLDDVPGTYSAGLPIVRGGVVYFARPTSATLLPAGEHRATAVFRPSTPGLLEAQTTAPLVITVTPLGLSPELDVLDVPGDARSPYAELSLEGEYVESLGTPAGSWALTAERDGTELVQTTIDVEAGEGPATVSLAEFTKPGTTVVVTAEFTPDAAVSPGVEAETTSEREIVTPALTPAEWLTRAIAVPWWLAVVALVLVVGSVVAAVLVVVRKRHPRTAEGEGEAAGSSASATPTLEP